MAKQWTFRYRCYGSHTEGDSRINKGQRTEEESRDLAEIDADSNFSLLGFLRPFGLYRNDEVLLQIDILGIDYPVFRAKRVGFGGAHVEYQFQREVFSTHKYALDYRLAELAGDKKKAEQILDDRGMRSHSEEAPSKARSGEWYFWTRSRSSNAKVKLLWVAEVAKLSG